MSWKKEPCRNFQRGSCRYGDRCKFLHVNPQQQQPKPNPFGFGSASASPFPNANQQQQGKANPNPFGFGAKQQQQQGFQKPFENKWVRPTNSAPSEQPRKDDHKCTDPQSCKQLIVDDFSGERPERPIWKLSCYAHFKGLPCDITGDVSYEELRAAAYEDAKRGLPLQSIVERERNLLNAKLTEFENLLQNPYTKAQAPTGATANGFTVVGSAFPAQPSMRTQSFNFGQTAATSTNIGPNFSSQPSNLFGQSSAFQSSDRTAHGFGLTGQASGPFSGQSPAKQFAGSLGPNFNDPKNSFGATQSNIFPAFPNNNLAYMPKSNNQLSANTVDAELDDKQKDYSIWLKDKWEIREIPEDEPPARFCR